MADQDGFVTEESNPTEWASLKEVWEGEHKSGTIMRGNLHYSVFIKNDVPKFKPLNNENLYNSVSMGK
jgi:hypothetical protein